MIVIVRWYTDAPPEITTFPRGPDQATQIAAYWANSINGADQIHILRIDDPEKPARVIFPSGPIF